MGYHLEIKTPAKKYIKKIQDKKLKSFYQQAFEEIENDPYTAGNLKKGDIAGVFVYDFSYQGTEHKVAYTVKDQTITFLLAGTHETFYKQLKRYWH